jgi:hypothetical protein
MHAAYISNITSSTGGQSPWELLKGNKPDVSNLHLWGCTCWVHVPAQTRNKRSLPAKAVTGKFMDYAQPNFKAYRILLPTGRVTISRDVQFDESTAPACDMQVNMLSDLLEAGSQPQPQQQPPQQQQSPPQQQPPNQIIPDASSAPQQPAMSTNPLFNSDDEEDQQQQLQQQ